MPLTAKGNKIMSSMKSEYGSKKGKSVFYASANSGKITGVHGKSVDHHFYGHLDPKSVETRSIRTTGGC